MPKTFRRVTGTNLRDSKKIVNSIYVDSATSRIKTQKPSSSRSRIRGFCSLIIFSQFPRVNRQKNVAVIGGRIKKKSRVIIYLTNRSKCCILYPVKQTKDTTYETRNEINP